MCADAPDAVEQANAAALAVLKQLAADMAQHKVQLAAAMQLGILLTTLADHSRAATKAGWSVPLVGHKEQQEAAISGQSSSSDASSSGDSALHPAHDGVFRLSQLWPNWMSGSSPNTVKNDVEMRGFTILTGPNMAGERFIPARNSLNRPLIKHSQMLEFIRLTSAVAAKY